MGVAVIGSVGGSDWFGSLVEGLVDVLLESCNLLFYIFRGCEMLVDGVSITGFAIQVPVCGEGGGF